MVALSVDPTKVIRMRNENLKSWKFKYSLIHIDNVEFLLVYDIKCTYTERENGITHSQAPDQNKFVLRTGNGEKSVRSNGQTRYGGCVAVHGGV